MTSAQLDRVNRIASQYDLYGEPSGPVTEDMAELHWIAEQQHACLIAAWSLLSEIATESRCPLESRGIIRTDCTMSHIARSAARLLRQQGAPGWTEDTSQTDTADVAGGEGGAG